MKMRDAVVRRWRSAPIGFKFGAIMAFMMFLILFTAVIGSIALRMTLNHVESVILTSTEIRELTMEIDRELQHARQLERAFFMQWPRIGFEQAMESSGYEAKQRIRKVIELTGSLRNKLDNSAISRELQEAVLHLEFYLSAAERYAGTFGDAVILVSELARQETGRQTNLAVLSDIFIERIEMLQATDMLLLFRTYQTWQNLYLGTRQRPDMQSALNALKPLQETILSSPDLTEISRQDLLNILVALEYVIAQILELDWQLEDKFREFDLQISALTPISEQLTSLARLEVDRARDGIDKTRWNTTLLLFLAVLFAMALGMSTALVMHRSITRKFAALTLSADRLRGGDFQARATVRSSDEIGRLAETFNTMAERISNLMHDLQQRFEMSQIRLFQGIESIEEGFALFDKRDGLVTANRNVIKLLPPTGHVLRPGATFRECLASVIDAGLFRGERASVWMATQLQMFRRGAGSDELRLTSGRVLKIRYSRTQHHETVVLLEDVTERVRMEEQRLDMERQLLHAQKLESLGVLAGGIAHDFNNLLSAMMGNMELALALPSLEDPARKRILQAHTAARRAADLTRQMLAYSGKGGFEVRPLMLNDLVQDNVHIFRTALPKNIRLILNLAPSLPLIRADSGQIQQVIMNLITNAAEAIGDQPGTMTLSTRVRYCDADCIHRSRTTEKPAPGWHVLLAVQDSGDGMSDEILTRLFDPFFSTKFTGRGLGLSAVLGIIRGHRGGIIVESSPGSGTTFEVLFPLDESVIRNTLNDGEPPVGEESVLPEMNSTIPELVLVVDDEEMVRELSVEALQHLGYSVLVAEDGLDGVRIFKEYQEHIGCVILDLMMPNMDGVTAFAELRKIRKDIPVILCSGYSPQETEQRFAGDRPTAFLQKPFSIKALQKTLQTAFNSYS
ncbi:Signal transduction histidine kinase, nitrogen specific [Desulfonatronum thiosulfatophilum]|uniref:histidine kinase n=1 Tax=Desulfonatronum thiosulfatophilum TaxID=617002 RepID=A0A1G6A0H1_9BACT|nr:response regulator [Desulfonatronum thiosulfatophilum]SDB01810.1 Signal transduction histidine kinase, nitrogen specific [Desulfonatronum thiosulfatophilum]